MESEGRIIHGQALKARESGDFLGALQHIDKALIAYQEAGDVLGMAESLSDRSLTLRHLYQKTNDKNYLILVIHSALAALELAQSSGQAEALAIPLFNVAKGYEEQGDLNKAEEYYIEAVENIKSTLKNRHYRPAVIGDFEAHLAAVQVQLGDPSAISRLEKAAEDIKSAEEEKYSKDVWLSGAYMKLATVSKDSDPTRAKEWLNKAREIIESNPDLTLRQEQLEKLEKTF